MRVLSVRTHGAWEIYSGERKEEEMSIMCTGF